MAHLDFSAGSAADRSSPVGARRQEGDARHTPMSAERREQIARLHAEARDLRARMAGVKAEYEAGQLSLDRELALVREHERELVGIGARIHDLASEHP